MTRLPSLLGVFLGAAFSFVACGGTDLVPVAQNGPDSGGGAGGGGGGSGGAGGGAGGGSTGCAGSAPACFGDNLQTCCGQDPAGSAVCENGQWMCGSVGAPGCNGRSCLLGDSGVDASGSCVGTAPNCFGNDSQQCCGQDPSGPATCQGGQWMCGSSPAPGCDGTSCNQPADSGVSDVNVVCPPGECIVSPGGTCQAPSGPQGNGCCQCTGDTCTGYCVCASPDTLIATPDGEVPISRLRVGDIVYSERGNGFAAVPIREVTRTRVSHHVVAQVTLVTGTVLRISAPHPTADGRPIGSLRAGDLLDGVLVLAVETVPYVHDYTYDILPDSPSGTYVAGGVLIGSTLAPGFRVRPN